MCGEIFRNQSLPEEVSAALMPWAVFAFADE
jgi:hypothetical protein